MNTALKLMLILILLLTVSYIVMYIIHVDENSIGLNIASHWCSEIGLNSSVSCIYMLNSSHSIAVQSIALMLFLFVIAMTVIRMEWRVGAVILSIVPLILFGVVQPQQLINSVSWNLIMFLIGSMTLAGILKGLGLFRYLAMLILRISRGNIYLLLALLTMLSFALAAVLDEVTSIIYVTILVLELRNILKVNILPLLILTVLATNTGSSALPIGNPIGVYILFSTRMSISMFIRYALPLSIINYIVLLLYVVFIERKTVSLYREALEKSGKRLEVYITSYYSEVYNAKVKRIKIGVAILLAFILMVAFNDFIVHSLTNILGVEIDPHGFLSFIPYIFIVLSIALAVPLDELTMIMERAVEWSSIVFFIMLFMLSYTLTYTGVMAKLAYAFSFITTTQTILLIIMLISSSFLSSVLDNLSVIVAFTPIAMLFKNIGLSNDLIYFSLLFGGVFGGNYTPVGSTANIIAISLAEKRKIRVTWREWLKIAMPITSIQIAISAIWIYMNTYII